MLCTHYLKSNDYVLICRWRRHAIKLKGLINVKTIQCLKAPKKVLVPLNKFQQPMKKAGSVFNRSPDDVARRPELCSLHHKEWRLVARVFKDRVLVYIRVTFYV